MSAVVFEYPVTDPLLRITLPGPDFDNTFEISPRRIAFETRDKTPIVFRDNNWIAPITFTLKFSNLGRGTIDKLIYFLEYTLGQLVKYTDYEANTWNGIIINPNGVMSEAGRDCADEVELTFEVVP